MPSPAAIKGAMQRLQNGTQDVADLRTQIAEMLQTWKNGDSANYSFDYWTSKRDELVQAALADLQIYADTLASDGVLLTTPPPPDSRPAADQLLDESRQARAWARCKGLLEAPNAPANPSSVVKGAADDADITTLKALREELPTWIMTTQSAAATRDERRAVADGVLRMIDIALARALPEGPERLVLRGRLLWDAMAPIVQAQLKFAQSELESNGRMSGLQNAIEVKYLSDMAQPVFDAIGVPFKQVPPASAGVDLGAVLRPPMAQPADWGEGA